MADIFGEAAVTPAQEEKIDSFLDKYVGDGKKYKDVEELAKAYHNADNFIPKLKNDLDALKEFTLTQLAERADANNRQPDPNDKPKEEDRSQEKPADRAPPKEVKEVDLDERIKTALEERDEQARLQKNARFTEDVMVEHYGSKEAAVEAIKAKAVELDCGVDFISNTAFTSPKAFFGIMGITEVKPRSSNTPNASSDVNPRMVGEKFGGPKPNTYAWYDNIRKTDPKRYARPEFQKQLMDDAMRLGENFFKR